MGEEINSRGRHGRSLPQQIISKILVGLPPKPLIRFTCVSKTWFSIIKDPYFASSYTRPDGINLIVCTEARDHYRSGKCSYNFFYTDPQGKSPLKRLTLPAVPRGYHLANLHTVRGLVCVGKCIWNPTTNESIVIPSITQTTSIDEECFSDRYRVQYFLGFDSSINAYKVLCLLSMWRVISLYSDHKIHHKLPIQFKILNLGCSSWRDIEYPPSLSEGDSTFLINRGTNDQCSIDNMIYISIGNAILTFDFRCEKFDMIPYPEGLICAWHVIQVGECVALINDEIDTMWILEDYKKHQWRSESLVVGPTSAPLLEVMKSRAQKKLKDKSDYIWIITPLGTIHTAGEILFTTGVDNKILYYYYDIGSKKVRMVPELSRIIEGILEPGVSVYHGLYIKKHVESIYRLM